MAISEAKEGRKASAYLLTLSFVTGFCRVIDKVWTLPANFSGHSYCVFEFGVSSNAFNCSERHVSSEILSCIQWNVHSFSHCAWHIW